MITNKPSEKVISHSSPRQRLGNKTLFTNIVKNQNNIDVRYFSGIDAEIYFEDVFIDETVQIAFNVQQQALPLYGYNSYVYDDIALGSRIVNGQFTINFTRSNYMYQVLDTLVGIKNNNQTSMVKNISSRAPLWNKTFDIYMSYGDARQSNRVKNSTILVLKRVSLTSCSQELDYSGKPIHETYSFVAKDIDFITEGEYQEQTTPTVKHITPIINSCFNPVSSELVKVQFDFDKEIEVTDIAYRFTCMNFYESAYSSDGSSVLTDTYKFETPDEVSKLVFDAYDNNKGALRISVMVQFKDKDGRSRGEEQVIEIPKRDI